MDKHRTEKIEHYQHELDEHIMHLIDGGYKSASHTEIAALLALVELYNELCEYKDGKLSAYGEHNEHHSPRTRHDEHEEHEEHNPGRHNSRR